MAGLAYLFLPISGALAYFNGKRPRTRFHGLQAVLLGVLWPAALYAGSAIGPGATFGAAVAGAVIWLAFMLIALIGKDPRLPLIGKTLQRWAATSRINEHRAPDGNVLGQENDLQGH